MTPDSPETILLLGGKLDDDNENGIHKDEHFRALSNDEADIRIEEAVLGLARGIFMRGWRLAFQHDAVLTPLVIEVAMEYWQSLPGEEKGFEARRFSSQPVVIFGGRLEEEEHEVIEYAVQIGCVKFVPETHLTEIPISRVVCIGGSRQAGEYIDWLNEQDERPPVFTIPSTGGVAQALSYREGVSDLERGIEEALVSQRAEMHFEPPDLEASPEHSQRTFPPVELEPERVPEFRYALYPLLVNAILDLDSWVIRKNIS